MKKSGWNWKKRKKPWIMWECCLQNWRCQSNSSYASALLRPFWFFLTRFDFIIVWIMVIIANYNLLFRLLGATFFIWRALGFTVHCFRMHAFAIQLVINWIYSWHVSLLFRLSSSAGIYTGWTKQKRANRFVCALPLHWNQCDRLRYWIWFSDCMLAHWVCLVWKP